MFAEKFKVHWTEASEDIVRFVFDGSSLILQSYGSSWGFKAATGTTDINIYPDVKQSRYLPNGGVVYLAP